MTTSLITQRVLYNTTDISVAVGDYKSTSYALSYTTGNYIYVGMTTPFNNLWIDMTTPSGISAGSPTVQIWWAQQWSNAVDILDMTSGMTATGRIAWATDYLKGWDRELKSVDVGLTGTAIYDRYWVRISWPSNFSASINYIGQKFSSDSTLEIYYPDLLQSAIMNGFKTGKTNWNDQHYIAAESILKELRKRNFIQDRGQVFDWTAFEEASCRKVAEIAYSAFGLPYAEHAAKAKALYLECLNDKAFSFDKTMDGHMTMQEHVTKEGWISR